MPTLAQNLGETSLVPIDGADVPQLLEKSGWMDELAPGQLQVMARYLGAYRAPKAKTIFLEGAREAFLCVVVSGKVTITKENSAHRKRELVNLGRGRILGELSLVDGEPRSATAVAAEESVLLVLTKAGFDRLSDDFPRLALQLLARVTRTVSQKLRQTSGILVEYLRADPGA